MRREHSAITHGFGLTFVGALALPGEALAGWGPENWGAPLFSSAETFAVPAFEWLGLALLALGLAATTAWLLCRRPRLGSVLLLALGLSLAHSPAANAAHQFSGDITNLPGVFFLPLTTGQKVEFTIEGVTDGGNPMVGGSFDINILDYPALVHPDVNWSPGDVVKLTINGISINIDSDSNLLLIMSNDPLYPGLQGALTVGSTFTLEMVSGSIWLEGFNFADNAADVDLNASVSVSLLSSDPVLSLPQLGAFLVSSPAAPVPPRAADALANDEDHDSPPVGQLPLNVGVPVTIEVLGTTPLTDVNDNNVSTQWQLTGGNAIRDYDISSDRSPGAGFVNQCEAVDFLPADLFATSELTTYFRDVGTAQVAISDTVNGDPASTTVTYDVVRDPKAESYRVTGSGATGTGLQQANVPAEDRANVLGEHQTWHDDVEALVDPGEFLRFHRGYLQKFDCWRQLFGYPCVAPYVSGPNYVPTGDGVDHAGTACSSPNCDPPDGSGDGIVLLERDTSGYATIPPLPTEFTIAPLAGTKLADFADENALATALEPHVSNVIAALDAAGDLSVSNRAPADPLFWRVHRTAAEVFALWQFLRLDGGVLRVPVVPGETDAVVHFPDPNFQDVALGCPGGVIESCTPASGSTLALGVHPVSCTVRDATLLDPLANPAVVGGGTTTTVNFTVEVLEPADIMLVLDDTASMQFSANDGTSNSKIDALQNAVEMFSDLLGLFRSGLGDQLGVLSFKVPSGGDNSASCQFNWGTNLVGADTLDDVLSQVHPAVLGMPADGIGTPIRQGLVRARNLFFSSNPERRRVMLMMTDGYQTTLNCTITDGIAFKTSDIDLHDIELLSIGFGGSSVNGALLSDVSDFYESADGSVDLANSFANMLAIVLNQDIVLDPQGTLGPGQSQTFTLPITSQANTATFLLNWAQVSSSLDLLVQAPDGTIVTSSTTASGLEALGGSTYQALSFRFPLGGALAGNHAGNWSITASRPGGGGQEPFNLMVLSDSPLKFNPILPTQRVRTREMLPLLVRLDGSFFGASVTAEVQVPQAALGTMLANLGLSDAEVIARTPNLSEDNTLLQRRVSLIDSVGETTVSVSLFDDGAHGDGAAADGLYGGVLGPLEMDGAYSVLFRAQGVVSDLPFQREVQRSFYVGVGVSVLDDLQVDPFLANLPGLGFQVGFRPTDSSGLLLGPGFAYAINAVPVGGSVVEVVDNNDGSYAVLVVLDPGIENTIMNLSILGTTVSTNVLLMSGGGAVPALSGWRLGILMLFVMTLGLLVLRSRQNTATGRPS